MYCVNAVEPPGNEASSKVSSLLMTGAVPLTLTSGTIPATTSPKALSLNIRVMTLSLSRLISDSLMLRSMKPMYCTVIVSPCSTSRVKFPLTSVIAYFPECLAMTEAPISGSLSSSLMRCPWTKSTPFLLRESFAWSRAVSLVVYS